MFTWFKQRFSEWSDEWHEIFNSNDLWFIPRPQYHFPPTQSWQSLPNLTMLGDAAHVTPPSGEGVNLAMLDALELSGALCTETFSTVQEAIVSFETKMLNRTSVETEETIKLVEGMHAETNLTYLLDFFSNMQEQYQENG